jgi:hypothetical protein
MLAIPNGCGVNVLPHGVGKSHCIELIKLVNLRRGDIGFIVVNSTMNVFRTVTNLETLNNALVHGLDMCSEVWCKVLDFNVLNIVGNDVTREIIFPSTHLVCGPNIE